jgi:TetR/AcrR family transcriptional regulator, upper aerobic nicotinate degradation pathway regulator
VEQEQDHRILCRLTEQHGRWEMSAAPRLGAVLVETAQVSRRRRVNRRGRPRKEVSETQQTRDRILQAATAVFAQHGLGGGRVKLVARAAKSNERMIYYYFGSKERLFIAVLENVYRQMWEAENALQLDRAPPIEAVRVMVDFTIDHYLSHPEMLTILNNENLHRGRYVSKSKELKRLSSPALDLMSRIYDRGTRDGVFRAGLNPVQIYLSILALNYFYVSNRYTLSAYLGIDLGGEQLNSWRRWVSDVIIRAIKAK